MDRTTQDALNAPTNGSGTRRRQLVLTVEDERHDWEIYGKLLWYNGFDVLYAQDAETGARLAEEHHPDVVLSDLMLPGIDGIELCRRLKRHPETGDIPFVLLTARSAREFGEEARRAGCTRFLEKPIGPLDVLHTLEAIVGRPPLPVD